MENEKNEIIINSNELAHTDYSLVQSNKLVESWYCITGSEQKVLNAVMAQVRQHDTMLPTYVFTAEQIASICGFEKRNIKRLLNNVVSGLMGKTFSIQNDDGSETVYHWIHCIKFDTKTMTIKLSDDLIPYLIALKKDFTTKKLESLQCYDNGIAMRLDLYFSMKFKKSASGFKSNVKKKEYILRDTKTFYELKRMLGYDKKYDRNRDFYHRIIVPAIEEIQFRKTFNIDMEVEGDVSDRKDKMGRINFTVTLGENNDFLIQLEEEIKKAEEREEQERERKEIEESKKLKLEELLKKYHLEDEQIASILKYNQVKNIGLFLSALLEKRAGGQEVDVRMAVLDKFLNNSDEDALKYITS